MKAGLLNIKLQKLMCMYFPTQSSVTINQGVINGNIITLPNPSNPENPIIGTISSDGRTITWTEGGQLLETTTRDDIDECADASGTNPCDGTPGTGLYGQDR